MLQTLFEYNNHPTKTKNDVAIRYRGGLYCEFKKSIIFLVLELIWKQTCQYFKKLEFVFTIADLSWWYYATLKFMKWWML